LLDSLALSIRGRQNFVSDEYIGMSGEVASYVRLGKLAGSLIEPRQKFG
jgi:hypothetical protein